LLIFLLNNIYKGGVAQKIGDEIPPASMPDDFFNTPPNQPIFDFECNQL
jgi:hypothetical protein